MSRSLEGRGKAVLPAVVAFAQLRVVSKCLADLNQLDGQVMHLLKVITRMTCLVGNNIDQSQVGYGILKIHGFVGWIGVVKSADENTARLLVGKVIVEKRCFGMPDLKIAGRLRRDA
jgi:hypothetical protein